MTKVLFLCNSNRGKSQMAAALTRLHAPDWEVYSAGVQVEGPGAVGDVNQEACASLSKVGADMSAGVPKPVSACPDADQMDHVIIVGGASYDGPATRWEIKEPSTLRVEGKRLEGEERMDALRDDIDARVRALIATEG